MKKNQLLTQVPFASIGEEIGVTLGTKFIREYQIANPTDIEYYVIGRNIIDAVLAQPGCVGIRFYNAYNELGEKTLVYVGINENGNPLIEYTSVNNEGILEVNKGIVADRVKSKERVEAFDDESWGWTID